MTFKSIFGALMAAGITAHASASAAAETVACTGKNLMSDASPGNVVETIRKAAESISYGEGLLWKIERAGVKPSYLFGTMHLSDPRLLDLPPKVTAALESADTLAVEIKAIADPDLMKKKAASLGHLSIYTDGTTLEERLSEDEIKLVRDNLARRAPLPWPLAKRLRPWALMASMAAPACELARKKKGEPVLDQALAQRAGSANKPVIGLETLESQMAAMASLPEPVMLKALTATSRMGDVIDDVLETMIALYEQEKTGIIWAMMNHVGPGGLEAAPKAAGYSDFQRVIVDKRNITMSDAADELLKKGNAFIAVGALHLPGEKGMLNILVQRGYKVSRP